MLLVTLLPFRYLEVVKKRLPFAISYQYNKMPFLQNKVCLGSVEVIMYPQVGPIFNWKSFPLAKDLDVLLSILKTW